MTNGTSAKIAGLASPPRPPGTCSACSARHSVGLRHGSACALCLCLAAGDEDGRPQCV